MSVSDPAITRTIRTLIVDDSAFVRKVVREMLVHSPSIEVIGMANDGQEALRKVADLKPDVVTCDLNMPRFSGVDFVREQMARAPVPILLLSSSPLDGPVVVEAMGAGAVDFVQKPSALASDDLLSLRDELIEKVISASAAPRTNLRQATPPAPLPMAIPRKPRIDAVVLGISTGGPQALRYLLPQLPADFPAPILIVLHMPVGYTGMFAAKLDELSPMTVREARDGELVGPGIAIIAQAGRHLTVLRDERGVSTSLQIRPMDKPHRPSVDVLFKSAADVFKSRLLAIVMTGMGDDGKIGAASVKAQGGAVFTEASESCVIYGMPRTVEEAGLSDRAVPLFGMAEAIMKSL